MKNLPVLLVFKTESPVQVFGVSHTTDPLYQFGKIAVESLDQRSQRITYKLLNPNDSDEVTLLTDTPAELALYAKAEGLRTKEEPMHKESPSERPSPLLLGTAALVASILSSSLQKVSKLLAEALYNKGKKRLVIT